MNLASRLETQGVPGKILVAEGVAERLAGRYSFGPTQLVDLKGKGPTQARFLIGTLEPGGGEILVSADSAGTTG